MPRTIEPRVTHGGKVIESYGGGGFKVAGERFAGPVLVFPQRTLAWNITTAAAVNEAALTGVTGAEEPVEILIIGCGRRFAPPPPGLSLRLRAVGIALEWMDTGAACRTFNVLLGEGRRVAAALIAVE